MSNESPRSVAVTVGIPVYNGGATIGRAIESVLDQTYADLELLIVDNASNDDTQTICEEFAAQDRRVRYVRNPRNIGQNQNFTRVFELSRGTYFRWLGDGDWLEPEYVEECVAAFEHDPNASLVTTYQQHVADDGRVQYEEYQGIRPIASDPIDRLSQVLRLLTGSPLWIDPVYSLARRRALEDSSLIRPLRFADQILACELAMWGPYAHVPRLLAGRSWAPLPQGKHAYRQYTGIHGGGVTGMIVERSQRLIMLTTLWNDIGKLPQVTTRERVRGGGVLVVYVGRLLGRRMRRLWRRLESRPVQIGQTSIAKTSSTFRQRRS